MPPPLYAALWIAGSFLLGAIPFGYLIPLLRGVDIRARGSGNIGMTNVWRSLGWRWGLPVLILDALKGLAPVLLAAHYGPSARIQLQSYPPMDGGNVPLYAWLPLACGLSAILGHTFTPFLRFKGGKGVATGLGVLIALFQLWLAIPLGVFLLALAATRMVSAGSLAAALAVAALPFAIAQLRYYWPLGLIICALVFFTHRSNIKRIINGTESRISGKKGGGDASAA